MKIGFIGLGIMGSRMAANLLKNGYELIVYNRTKEKAEPLLENGAELAGSPAEAAKVSDVMFTMLANPDAVKETALGKNGFLTSMKRNSIWVDCSTVNPSFSKEMSERSKENGIRFLDAPVAGTKDPAEKGELIIFVGGDEKDFNELKPALQVLGKKVLHMGDNGKGTSMKMVVNLMLANSMVSFAEAMTLGESLGFPKETLFNTLIGGPVTAPFLASKKEKIKNENFDTEFPLQHMQKDLHLVDQTAFENHISLPLSNISKEIYGLAIKNGFGKKDFSAVYEFLHSSI
jgi:3-hydroxyisobutyrate dehydrogenase/glyoxylate/succinic semialdehyde reductase